MSSPENPRVEVVQERLEQTLPILSSAGCPPISCPELCGNYKGNCRRCWLEYLKGEEQ